MKGKGEHLGNWYVVSFRTGLSLGPLVVLVCVKQPNCTKVSQHEPKTGWYGTSTSLHLPQSRGIGIVVLFVTGLPLSPLALLLAVCEMTKPYFT